jgi:aspartate aminotransferase/aminotransferase
MLKTPFGTSAMSMDRTMLMSMWAKTLIEKPNLLENPNKEVLLAGIGHPTLPVDPETVQFAADYWKKFSADVTEHYKDVYQPEEITNIANNRGLVRHYGHPQGELCYREQASEALSTWYGVDIKPQYLMFTNGGCASLYNIFRVLHNQSPNGSRIILPTPCYPLHISSEKSHIPHPMNVLELPGYEITAKAIQASIEEANKLAQEDGAYPSAIVICDPYNPLGTTLDASELPEIVKVLEQYPDILLVLDEPYAEMTFDHKHQSIFSCCSSIEDRVVAIRSATKSFSLAGERMSVTICRNKYLMSQLLEINIMTAGHAATSLQAIYAFALTKLSNKKMQRMKSYYQPQVEYAYKRLVAMGAAMPDESYKPNSTFYILCDLKDMYYLPRSAKAKICNPSDEPHTTAEEIAYTLLFSEAILITPLSYYGLNSDTPYFRITCAIGTELLGDFFDRLESKLVEARLRKQMILAQQVKEMLARFDVINPFFAEEARQAIALEYSETENISLAWHLKNNIKAISDCIVRGSQMIRDYNKANAALKSVDVSVKPSVMVEEKENKSSIAA